MKRIRRAIIILTVLMTAATAGTEADDMAINKTNIRRVDLTGGIVRDAAPAVIGEGDIGADRFGIDVFRNGAEADLTGVSCAGYFVRQNGDTVVITGTVNGNRAYVDLPQACYAYEGQFSLAIKLTGGDVTGTMRIVDGVVRRTTTDTTVDPGTLVPSIEDLIEAIEEATAAIPEDYSELQGDVSDITQNALFVGGSYPEWIPANSDMNDYTTPGNYRVQNNTTAASIAHIPVPVPGRLTVMSTNLAANYIQIYQPVSSRTYYYRYQTGSWEVNAYRLAATGDTSDRSTVIRSMLLNDGACHLGPGDFYVSGINMPDNTILEGEGDATRIIMTGTNSTEAVNMGSMCTIRNISFYGSLEQRTPTETIGTKNGIRYEGNDTRVHGIISGCRFYNFNGAGIYANDTGYGTSSGISISDCLFRYCDVGLYLKYLTEYHRVIGCSFTGCYYGCINNGGNNNFSACGFNSNAIGFLIDNSSSQSSNNAHGSCVGCNFNHSGSNAGDAIKILGSSAGFVFDGLNIFYGKINLSSSSRVIFMGLNAGSGFAINISGGGLVIFNGCSFRTGDDFSATITNNTKVRFVNCYDTNGDPVDPTT